MKQIWMAGVVMGGVLVMNAVGLAQGAAGPASGITSSLLSPNQQAEAREAAKEIRTVYVKDSERSDMFDLLNALRNLFPSLRVYAVSQQHAVSLEGSPEEIAKAEKVIAELDNPRKQYRLTYRFTETDGGKRIGDQAFSLVLFGGAKTSLKQGSKVPVSTGSSGTPGSTQIQYLDIGMNIDATAEAYGDGVKLQTKVEQSSLAEDKQGSVEADPIIRQSVLEGTSLLTPGKPSVLGSLDILGSTRHQEVEVEVQVMP